MFGMLSEHEVDRIFRDGLTLQDDVRWTPQQSNASWVQFGAFLDSPRESTLRITMGVSLLQPAKYKILVMRGVQVLRRLDARGSHSNPPGSDPGGSAPEVWKRRTHKHRWSDRFADSVAYTPTEISTNVYAPAEHEATFRAFCEECNITFTGAWSDPPQQRQTSLAI